MQVLGRIFSIHAVWGDQFNSVSAKLAIQFVGVIGKEKKDAEKAAKAAKALQMKSKKPAQKATA